MQSNHSESPMSMIDVTSLVAPTLLQPAAQQPRAVSEAAAQQFRDALAKPDCAGEACATQPTSRSMLSALEFDVEKILTSSMPSPSASPAQMAVGLLRAQAAISNISVAVQMAASTTQSLTQNVQALQRG
jgi:hypothetical protein